MSNLSKRTVLGSIARVCIQLAFIFFINNFPVLIPFQWRHGMETNLFHHGMETWNGDQLIPSWNGDQLIPSWNGDMEWRPTYSIMEWRHGMETNLFHHGMETWNGDQLIPSWNGDQLIPSWNGDQLIPSQNGDMKWRHIPLWTRDVEWRLAHENKITRLMGGPLHSKQFYK